VSAIDKKKKDKEARVKELAPKYFELRRKGLSKSAALREIGLPISTWRAWNLERGVVEG
jgi:hypothetical protein